jgi:hypothetical protein
VDGAPRRREDDIVFRNRLGRLDYAIALSEDHESGNTGDSTIELLWVTLKE